MKSLELLKLLNDLNPWWRDRINAPPEVKLPHRKSYKLLEGALNTRQILALTGLRRVGKSTIAKQIIGKLLADQNIDSTQICYFAFDDGSDTKLETLDEVLRLYVESICKEEVGFPKKQIYIFLDELQYVENWSSVIKRFYDISPNYKFIITGSASLFISKKVSESLAGRIFEFKINPLDFEESLDLQGISHHRFFTVDEVHALKIKDIQAELSSYISRMVPLFSVFLQRGQFPELLSFDDPVLIKKYLIDSVIKKVIYNDLPRLFVIENIDDLNTIFMCLARECGNMVEYQNLARDTAINESTVKRYISCLNEAFLVDLIYNFTKKHRQERRQLKKCYVASSNFSSMIYGWDGFAILPPELLGHFVENYIFTILNTVNSFLSFWRRGDKEIDFLIDERTSKLFIEVKFQNSVSRREIKTLISNTTSKDRAVVLSKVDIDEIFSEGKIIKIIPAWALKAKG